MTENRRNSPLVLIPRSETDRDVFLEADIISLIDENRGSVLYVDNYSGSTGEESVLSVRRHSDIETVLHVATTGLADTLSYAYLFLIPQYAGSCDVIVRMDCHEHPGRILVELMAEAASAGGAVAQPAYTDATMPLGSLDWVVHNHIVPALLTRVSPSLGIVSAAHGYQAWSRDQVGQLALTAAALKMTAARLSAGALRWGFDAAMLISACTHNISPIVIAYDAITERQRSISRNLEQIECLARMVGAHFYLQHGPSRP